MSWRVGFGCVVSFCYLAGGEFGLVCGCDGLKVALIPRRGDDDGDRSYRRCNCRFQCRCRNDESWLHLKQRMMDRLASVLDMVRGFIGNEPSFLLSVLHVTFEQADV